MKAVRFFAALAVGASFLLAHGAVANWRKGDAKDIRIKLDHPEFPGKYRIGVSVYDLGGGNIPAQSDHLLHGDIKNTQAPVIFASYASSSGFVYARLKEALKSSPVFEKAQIEYIGDVGTAASAIAEVEYIKFNMSLDGMPAKRSCAYWKTYFNGNRFAYGGYYCPVGREVTDEDVKKAVNAIVVTKKP